VAKNFCDHYFRSLHARTPASLIQTLQQLQTFTQDFPADMRGIAIGNADGIRIAHNSFAPPEAALSDNETRTAGADDDLYHFISFIHAAGSVWELDGLQPGPIRCCDCPHVRFQFLFPCLTKQVSL
jgi:hypothetical protein